MVNYPKGAEGWGGSLTESQRRSTTSQQEQSPVRDCPGVCQSNRVRDPDSLGTADEGNRYT
ncbi:hypothetical protein E2C01_002661 [Portunus trituberculatus]|uniref:Uncharacterized protein n=1 Tax=Portunus trituberculatus TaxID=210409 RepID=A0A5B7CNU2_PORTR|nr:hypothetical protein [Portunus trituberculatus]